jgi:hypothetical protein
MGDTMIQLEDRKFKIPKLSKLAAMKAVKNLIGHTETVHDKANGWHWAWVLPADVKRAGTFEQVLAAWHWRAELDGAGNVADLHYTADKRGDEELLFHTIAPFVETGSYLKFSINGTRILTYRFEGGRCIQSLV